MRTRSSRRRRSRPAAAEPQPSQPRKRTRRASATPRRRGRKALSASDAGSSDQLQPLTDVERQTLVKHTTGTLQNALYSADLETLETYIAESGAESVLRQTRDPVGAAPLHLLCLWGEPKHLAIAEQLVRDYPEHADVQYTGQEYKGENALHIAIVNRNLGLARKLVAACPSLISQRATGTFFSPNGPCYYGELPLSFAASTNQLEIARMLLRSGAQIDACDAISGNTALHMAVIHGMPEMYKLLSTAWAEQVRDSQQELSITTAPAEPPEDSCNSHGMTCLALAANVGKLSMFEFILEDMKEQEWRYGAVSCVRYPLRQLDPLTTKSAAVGAFETLVQGGRTNILSSERMIGLVDRKWNAFGKRCFYTSLLSTAFYVVLLFAAVMLPQRGVVRAAVDASMRVATAIRLIPLLKELWALKRIPPFRSGPIPYQNASTLACAVCIVAAERLRRGGHDDSAAMALATLSAWFNLFWYLLGWRTTGPFVIMIEEMFLSDMGVFLIISTIFIGGFSTAFHLLRGSGKASAAPAGTFSEQIEVCVAAMLGSFELDAYKNVPYPALSKGMLLVMSTLLSVILMNLLIAKMGVTFSQISDESERHWRLERARMILTAEQNMSVEQRQSPKNAYWVVVKNARYLQVQEVNANHWRKKKPTGGAAAAVENATSVRSSRTLLL